MYEWTVVDSEEVDKGWIVQGFVSQSMKLGFYSKHNGKSLEVFKHNMVNVYN